MNQRVVEIVLERAGFYCEKCGHSGSGFALHHRKLRSQGGEDTPSNLIAVHHGCHNLNTDSIHLNPAIAKRNGWIVPGWAEPHEFPMTLPDGSKVYLDDEGGYTIMEEGIEDGEDTGIGECW